MTKAVFQAKTRVFLPPIVASLAMNLTVRATFLITVLFSAESRAIVGGHEASNPLVKVSVWIDATGGSGTDRCSGTIISENLVLTAAHCFVRIKKAEEIYVFFPNESLDPRLYDLRLVTMIRNMNPSLKPDQRFQYHAPNDLVLLKLERSIPHGFRPARIVDGTYPVFSEDVFTVVGFGRTDYANVNSSNILKIYDGYHFARLVPFPKSLPAFKLEGPPGVGAARGDSGGGLFAMLDPQDPILLGVASTAASDGSNAYYTDLRPALTWIHQMATQMGASLL